MCVCVAFDENKIDEELKCLSSNKYLPDCRKNVMYVQMLEIEKV